MSFLDVAPPPPCTHYTHWWPALQGWAGWVGSTYGDVHCVPALPTLQIGETMGGVFSPISQWNPGLSFLLSEKLSFLDNPLLSCKRNCELQFPPLDAGTSKVKLG